MNETRTHGASVMKEIVHLVEESIRLNRSCGGSFSDHLEATVALDKVYEWVRHRGVWLAYVFVGMLRARDGWRRRYKSQAEQGPRCDDCVTECDRLRAQALAAEFVENERCVRMLTAMAVQMMGSGREAASLVVMDCAAAIRKRD